MVRGGEEIGPLSGLIGEGQKGALRKERGEKMRFKIGQHDKGTESIVRRIRDSTRDGK